MLNFVDAFLNNITMYRLTLYYLGGVIVAAFFLSFFHLLPFTPLAISLFVLISLVFCSVTNILFAKLFRADVNNESSYISALIVACLITPTLSINNIIILAWICLWTIASKYLLTYRRKHIYNPVAFGIWITSFGTQYYASWWVGTIYMLPVVLIGGLLIIRKLRREHMVITFLLAAISTISLISVLNKTDVISALTTAIKTTPLLFLAFVMFTEPLTTPPTKLLQTYYALLVGILFAPQLHVFSLRTTPESALLLGNIFSYIVSPKAKLFLPLQKKIQRSVNIFDFIFTRPGYFSFRPGQYMEWTLSHPKIDNRGNRRYLTLASSPTEENLIIGVRIDEQKSSFKTALALLPQGGQIIASQTAGDFVLPKDAKRKLVFIAGGIGITPFRSMVKFLVDRKEKRDIILIYTAKSASDFVYKEIFDQAQEELGIKIVYVVTDKEHANDWKGRIGRMTSATLKEEVTDYKERIFYLSGPHAMVNSFVATLKEMGVQRKQIKQDYFPGFA